MVSFNPGWNFAPPTGLKHCCDYVLNFSLGAKRKFPWESLLRCENTVNAHARVRFWARAEILFRLHETFSDFQARLAGLKILARFENTGLGFSACSRIHDQQADCTVNKSKGRVCSCNHLRGSQWNSPCNQALQPGLKFRSAHRAETLLWLRAQFQPANFREKVYWGAKTQSMRMLAFVFGPELKFCFDYMRLFQIFRPVWPGWKS